MPAILLTIVEAIIAFIVEKWLEYIWPRLTSWWSKIHKEKL